MGDFKRNSTGTPYVSDPVARTAAGKPRMVLYSRPSGFTKQIENTYNLQKWSERKIVTGLAHAAADPLASDVVSKLLQAIREPHDAEHADTCADTVIAKAKEFARSSLAADRGTWVHRLTELVDAGLPVDGHAAEGHALGIDDACQARLAAEWTGLLDGHGLEVLATELPVVNDEFRTAGTLDRVVRLRSQLTFATADGELVELPAGTVMVLDLKTGNLTSLHWWNNYASQVFLYASSVGYDCDANVRQPLPWPVDQRWGLLAHVDARAAIDGDDGISRLLLVDLEAGRHACELAAQAKAWSQRQGVFGSLHAVAAPADFPPAVAQPGAGTEPACRPGAHLTPQQQKAVVPAVDDGPDTRSAKDWVDLQSRYEDLAASGKDFLKHLMRESTQSGVSWHRKERTSDRRWHLYDAAISLAEHRYDVDWSCETLRALVAHVVEADWPLYPSLKTGHIFGSLTADEARRLAAAVRDLEAGAFVADLTRDVLELRRAA